MALSSYENIDIERLSELEHVIELGINTFVSVGNALMEIRDSRLYRNIYATFEDYTRERWGMARRTAYQLIEAAEVVENVRNCAQVLPENECQTRPLTQLDPEQQREVWLKVIELAKNNKITAEFIKSIISEVYPEKRKDVHVSFNSCNNEWYTPPEFIESARTVLGTIDLDPASSFIANQIVQATNFYTSQTNGLESHWSGNVWMNPPYSGDLVGKFINKLVYHYDNKDVKQAIVLVNNATETMWFEEITYRASAITFPRGRIKYINIDGEPANTPLQGQAFIYLGWNYIEFLQEFSKYGWGAVVHERIRV